ncbi:hypothetical protein M1247_21800 [Mycobacterium sp. 21AC1]|uniref:hypothetical protein n=1 Tax=[Mycobacterium] appelbergii TaxID=2939269 RepID=UPI002938F800|nr:hypothetical protein [Mycobacterium sp. 21AC1]MDV3127576.1 hypothetical protein [Mycobacterium sp. 21AC1]
MTMLWRRSRRLLAVVGSALLVLPAPLAPAAPGDGGALSVAPVLNLAALGSSSYLGFYGQQAQQTITLPVQPGLVPTEITATVWPPADVRAATLTVTQEDAVISRVELPTTGPAPISIPLPRVQIVENSVSLTMTVNLLPLNGYCLDPNNPLRLTDATMRFDGTERPPTTVADFLPPVLRKLSIFIPTNPSQAESDTAVKLTDAIVAHYGHQYTEVSLGRLDDGQTTPPGPSLPLERQIVVKESPDKGLTLQRTNGVGSLLISGPPAELANQSRLLSSDISRLALSSGAVAGPLHSTPQLPGDMTTIRKLGQPGVNSSSLSPEVYIGLDQTRLGRSAHHVRVHLRGSYTPLPDTVNGQLVASVGGQTVDRWTTEDNGVIDRWVDVPDDLLQRYTTLAVKVDITGNTGGCGEFQPITLTIDGETDVETKLAKPPVPPGFQSMPQSLMPKVQIGVAIENGTADFDDTARAIAIVTGLQRVSALPFDTSVAPIQEVLESRNTPAIIIAADGWNHPDIKLPVTIGGDQVQTITGFDDDGNPTDLTLEPSLQLGALQTVFDGDRSLLVATSTNAPERLDALINWLNADIQRWALLDGIAILSPPDRTPVTVAAPDNQAASGDSEAGSAQTLLFVGAGVAVLAALGGALLLLRARRRDR